MKKVKIFLGGYINYTNAQNLNCRALAIYLDKDKFPPRRSKVWNFQSVVNILRNPLYIGVDTMVDKTRKDKDGNYPIMKNIDESMRIVDDKLFGRVQILNLMYIMMCFPCQMETI